jgi:pimeloyl-ACP methyl ester carboxylesterase
MNAHSTTGQTASINGMEMYYEIIGQGEPLVLLHGFSGCGNNWQTFAPEFSKAYQLIIPDLRGHGRSTNPLNDFTFRQSGHDILALLDHLGIKTCKAIGLSGGAKTLLHLATQQPARIEAMVLVSAAPYFPDEARAIMRQMAPASHTDEEWQLMREWHAHGDEQIRKLWTQAHLFKDSYDDMNFTPPKLATITAKTLIVHGDRDPFYPVALALGMYQAIPQAYLWIIPGGGHGPIFMDLSALFIETALTFFRGAWEKK